MPLDILQCTGQVPTAKNPSGHHVTGVEVKKPCFTQGTTPTGGGPWAGKQNGLDCLVWSVGHMYICYMSMCPRTTHIHATGGQGADNLMLLCSPPSDPSAMSK